MTLLFALIPSLVAVAIFVGTFRLSPPSFSKRPEPPRAPRVVRSSRVNSAIRTPLPVGAVRRGAAEQLQA
ncbi:MAG: hypothetical protein U0263_17800 [Polyangiaceae bacterium]